jgi:8-amino-7-oxononanoate synthase
MAVNQSFDKHLKKLLDQKEANGLLRRMVSITNKIDFCSNDYLGFASKTDLIPIHTVENPLPNGSTGSRLITGNSNLAESTEILLAQFHKTEAALIYSCGYMANLGFFSCIASKGDTILSDQYIHASIIDGIRLSKANRNWFKHNDLKDLEAKLREATQQIFVVIESIYSMDGDETPLRQIADLCSQYKALLIVDEAHSTGIYGEKGEGLVCQYHLEEQVYARIHTFGKALGAHGAVIVGSTILRDYLINYSRPFIYTTGVPPAFYRQIQQIYNLLPHANRAYLFELIEYFRNQSQYFKNIQRIDSLSPIQAIIIGDNCKAKKIENQLLTKGFFVKAILSPTVPVGTERLRISIHAFNTKSEIEDLWHELNAAITEKDEQYRYYLPL